MLGISDIAYFENKECSSYDKKLIIDYEEDLSSLNVTERGKRISDLVKKVGGNFRDYLQKELGSGIDVLIRRGALQTCFVEFPGGSYFLNGDFEKLDEKIFCKITITPFKLEEDSFARFLESYGNFAKINNYESD